MTVNERRHPPAPLWSFAGLRNLAIRALPKQSQFSVVTAMVFASLWLGMMIDLLVGHSNADRPGIVGWAIYFCVLAFVPIMLGQRFPRWMAVGFIGLLSFWSGYSIVNAMHGHMELNALLEAPVIAVYLGWFFRAWPARVILISHLVVLTVSSLFRPSGDNFEFSSPIALMYAIMIAGICLESAIVVRKNAQRQYRRDPLTGVLNRRGLVELGERAIERAHQSGAPLSVAVVDLDNFKDVNDTGGHAEGDRALQVLSAMWVAGLGERDLVARTGGDEFVLVIHEPEPEACERLTAMSSTAEFEWSWGLVPVLPGDDFDEAIARADAELYVQKRLKQASESG